MRFPAPHARALALGLLGSTCLTGPAVAQTRLSSPAFGPNTTIGGSRIVTQAQVANGLLKGVGGLPAAAVTSDLANLLNGFTGTYQAPFPGSVGIPQQVKDAQAIGVREFGAACDGVTDDSPALAAAANALANSGAELVVPGNCRLRLGGAAQVWLRGIHLRGPGVREVGSQGYTYGQQGGTIIIDTPTLANGGVSPFLVSSDWSMTGLVFYWKGQTEYTAAAQPGTTAATGGAVPFPPLFSTHGTDYNYFWSFSDNQVENAYDVANIAAATDAGHFHWERNTEFAAHYHLALASVGGEAWITNNQFSIVGALYLTSGTNTAGPGGTQSPFYLRTFAAFNGEVIHDVGNGSYVATTASAATSNSNTVSVASAAGIAAGQSVSIGGGAATLTVVSVSGGAVTLSGNATIASGAALVFAAQSSISVAGLRFNNNYAFGIRYGVHVVGGNIGLSTFTDNGFDQVSTPFQADSGGLFVVDTISGGTWLCQNLSSPGGSTSGSVTPCISVTNAAPGNRITLDNVDIGVASGQAVLFYDIGAGANSPLLNITGGALLNLGNVSVGNPYNGITFIAPGGDFLMSGTTITTTAAAQNAAQAFVTNGARTSAISGVTFGGWNVADVVNTTMGLHSLTGSHSYGTTAAAGTPAVLGVGSALVAQSGNSWDVWNNSTNVPPTGLGASASGYLSETETSSGVDPSGNVHTTQKLTDGGGVYHVTAGGADYGFGAAGFVMGKGPILPSTTVSGLPTCNANNVNQMMVVTDAASPTYNGALTGGGNTRTSVLCVGTGWTAH